MPDSAKAEIVKRSKIGIELTGEQCGVLAELVEIGEYADGDVVVAEGATDDRLRVVLSGALAVAKRSEDGSWVRGFICEPWGRTGSVDISHHGGFRAFVAAPPPIGGPDDPA